MKTNLSKTAKILSLIGLVIIGAVYAAQAQPVFVPSSRSVPTNVVFKEKNIQVQITPSDFDSRSGLSLVTGTGQLRVSGTLTTAGANCCVRVKLVIYRFDFNSNSPGTNPNPNSRIDATDGSSNTIMISDISNVFKEQTFEICGSQTINLVENISSTQDDARFMVRLQNIDPWNKTNVSGTLTFRYPTADKILTGQPSVKFDLPQGIEANRAFKLSPNTPGKLKVKVVFNGSARVRVTLKKPDGSSPMPPVTGASGLEFTYDIKNTDITSGDTWTVNVLNLTDTLADDVDVQVIYTVEQ